MLALDVISPVQADVVHAVKSGVVIPFVVFAFGFPYAAWSPPTAGGDGVGGGERPGEPRA
ncbi:MAG: hypothetical protein R3F61_24775 [Myxococcota bacterium]